MLEYLPIVKRVLVALVVIILLKWGLKIDEIPFINIRTASIGLLAVTMWWIYHDRKNQH